MSSSSSTLSLSLLLPQLPFIIVTFVGLVMALAQRQRLGSAAVPALLGFGLIWMNALAGAFATLMIARLTAESGTSRTMGVMGLVSLVRTVIGVAGYACLIWAVFSGRPGGQGDESDR